MKEQTTDPLEPLEVIPTVLKERVCHPRKQWEHLFLFFCSLDAGFPFCFALCRYNSISLDHEYRLMLMGAKPTYKIQENKQQRTTYEPCRSSTGKLKWTVSVYSIWKGILYNAIVEMLSSVPRWSQFFSCMGFSNLSFMHPGQCTGKNLSQLSRYECWDLHPSNARHTINVGVCDGCRSQP